MYAVSDRYKEKILEPIRKFESEIKIGNITLTNDEVMSFNIEQSIQQDATFSIGNTISTSFNLVFFHNNILSVNDEDLIKVKLGLKIDENTIEYVPLGHFNIDSMQMNDSTTSITAYDNMVKFEVAYIENSNNPTIYTVIKRLEKLTGIEFGGDLEKYKNYSLSVLQNYSCREVLGFIAGVLGANAVVNREGKFDFVSISSNVIYGKDELVSILTRDGYILKDREGIEFKINTRTGYITPENYLDYIKKNKNYKISRVTNSTDVEALTIGTSENMELLTSNPYINSGVLKDINSNINGLEFLPYSVAWSGDVALDLGDLVAITDKGNNVRVHPILSHSISYNGALSCIIGAQGETTLANSYKPTSQEENEIARNNKKVVQIEKDAGELYVVVYDDKNNSSVRLTEKALEAIADEITLTAKNINLEGYVTANGNFIIDEEGNMTAKNGTFIGNISGSSSIAIGGLSQDGVNQAFRVGSSGNLRIGGNSAYVHTDGVVKGVAEITSLGTIYSCSTDESHTYTQITEGQVTVSSTAYDDNNNAYSKKMVIGGNKIKINDTLEVSTNGIKGYESLYLTCDNSSTSSTDGGAIRFFKNSNGEYVFRSVTEGGGLGNAHCGTTNFPWKSVNALSINQISDRNTKEGIEYLNDYDLYNQRASQGSNISTLDCYDFIKNHCMLATYNHVGDHRKKINFIANDLLVNVDGSDNKVGQLIINSTHPFDAENDVLSYDSSNYQSVTVGALQQAIKKIEQLEEEIELLKSAK